MKYIRLYRACGTGNTFWWQGTGIGCCGVSGVLINVWVGSTYVYILIELNMSFPSFQGALVCSLPHVAPSRRCLDAGSRRRERGCAGAHCRAARRRLSQSRSANLHEPERDHLQPRSASESCPIAVDVGAQAAPRGGSRGSSPPRQGLWVPLVGEEILPEEPPAC